MSKMQQKDAQSQIICQNKIKYSINSIDQTASVFGCEPDTQKVFIPASIEYESEEYYVISISKYCFSGSNIKSIEFSNESKLQTIEEGAFAYTSIESILIPNEVKIIGKNAFSNCRNFKLLEFQNESKLQTIEEGAFAYTSIESILIPNEVRIIGKNAFSNCRNFELLEFQKESKLQIIEEEAFNETRIESITIPSEVIDLKEGWCIGANKLTRIIMSPSNPRYCCLDEQMIIGKETLESTNYENLIFCIRNIKTIIIPNFIKRICSGSFFRSLIESITIPNEVQTIGKNAFGLCYELQQIEISNESKLQIIEEGAFNGTQIERIKIPSEVRIIGKYAFDECYDLEIIDISKESKLQIIEEEAFNETRIESITIPSEVIDLKEGWCIGANKLTRIIMSPSNPRYCCLDEQMIIGKETLESTNYENLIFCIRNIKTIIIPNFIKRICSGSFFRSLIESITIPNEVQTIGKNAFGLCYELQQIEFSNESKLQIIEEGAFKESSIKSIIIPSEVRMIGNDAFFACDSLQIIEFSENSKLDSVFFNLIGFLSTSIYMIPSNLKIKIYY